MRNWVLAGVMVGALALVGCGSSKPPSKPQGSIADYVRQHDCAGAQPSFCDCTISKLERQYPTVSAQQLFVQQLQTGDVGAQAALGGVVGPCFGASIASAAGPAPR